MERIASFCVDHTKLDRGMYLSRQDGDVLTWDIRMKKPNHGDYLSTGAAHTLEHLFATYARNSAFRDGVIYVGPMGCRTGFYLLTRGLTPAEALRPVVSLIWAIVCLPCRYISQMSSFVKSRPPLKRRPQTMHLYRWTLLRFPSFFTMGELHVGHFFVHNAISIFSNAKIY